MNMSHGETVIQKPINEYAVYLKSLLPANIPDTYALKPMFKNISSEENIRNGVIAFRDFMYLNSVGNTPFFEGKTAIVALFDHCGPTGYTNLRYFIHI